jgi:hypothetical protein
VTLVKKGVEEVASENATSIKTTDETATE